MQVSYRVHLGLLTPTLTGQNRIPRVHRLPPSTGDATNASAPKNTKAKCFMLQFVMLLYSFLKKKCYLHYKLTIIWPLSYRTDAITSILTLMQTMSRITSLLSLVILMITQSNLAARKFCLQVNITCYSCL